MFEKNMKFAYLLDFYSGILDDHTVSIMKAYYNDDLSLAEIAETEGISRQGIRHVVKKGEDQLVHLESCLHLAKRTIEIEECSSMLNELISKSSEACIPHSFLEQLKVINEKLLKGN